MLSAEFGRHDNESEDGETHVLKPSEIAKGRKRKNVQKEEPGENDDDFVPLAPKPGAHMVLPFIPPKFPSLKGEGNSLIKPSEYLRSLGSRPGPGGEMMERFSDDGASSSSGSSYGESGIDSPGSSLPSSGVSPPLPGPTNHLPVIREETAPPATPQTLRRNNSFVQPQMRSRLGSHTPTFNELQFKYGARGPSPVTDREYQKEARNTVVGELAR